MKGHGPVVGVGCECPDPRPYAVRMEVSLSAEEMTAALYSFLSDPSLMAPEELADDDTVWGRIAIVIAHDGLGAIRRRADDISEHEEADEHHVDEPAQVTGSSPRILLQRRERKKGITACALISLERKDEGRRASQTRPGPCRTGFGTGRPEPVDQAQAGITATGKVTKKE
jgi:hypothetical protein